MERAIRGRGAGTEQAGNARVSLAALPLSEAQPAWAVLSKGESVTGLAHEKLSWKSIQKVGAKAGAMDS